MIEQQNGLRFVVPPIEGLEMLVEKRLGPRQRRSPVLALLDLSDRGETVCAAKGQKIFLTRARAEPLGTEPRRRRHEARLRLQRENARGTVTARPRPDRGSGSLLGE